MDLATVEMLCSGAGEKALAAAMALAPTEATLLACRKRLEKTFAAPLARAALSQALLRQRAAAKFPLAARMLFEREALEQASSAVVATHRAQRFAGLGRIADLCSGLGGDTIALAGRGPVVAVDRDPVRLALARHNVAAHDRAAEFELRDVLALDATGLDGAFLDPDRRVGGRRQVSIEACEPSLGAFRARWPRDLPLGVKLASAVPWHELERLDAEVEFLSLDGELKECALWFGPARTVRRRATVLPSGETLAAAAPAPASPPGPVRDVLYDPDPAVVRAGLVSDLAARLEAHPLDAEIAHLTSPLLVTTPFARAYRVESAMPFHLGRLRDHLRQMRVGRVEVLRRGSAVEPEVLVRKLKLTGDEMRTLLLTRVAGVPWALVAIRAAP